MFKSRIDDIKRGINLISKDIRHIPIIGMKIKDFLEYLKYIIVYKKYLKENRIYKDMYKGKRCFVIGNGPSLEKQDLSLLKDEIVITVNSMSSTPAFETIKPKFHVVIDYLRFTKAIPEFYQKLLDLKKTKHKATYFFPVEFKKFVEENGISQGLDVKYLCRKLYSTRIYDIDFTKRIPFYPNVVNAALSLAIYLGFSEIYLLGCDLTNLAKTYDDEGHFSGPSHFYTKETNEKELQGIKSIFEDIDNERMLSTSYGILKQHRLTNYYAESKGIKIFNATRGGNIDVYPWVKYESLFKKS